MSNALMELAKRLEKAAPDSALDMEIAAVLGVAPQPYTSSIDAALSIIPDGWFWQINAHGTASVMKNSLAQQTAHNGFSSYDPALGICAAALRAHASEGGPHG